MSDCYELGPIRPPSEARSLLVRVARNCPWNRCVFCPVYKGARFSKRSVEEVLGDLSAMRRRLSHEPRTAFLQDADPLLIGSEALLSILEGMRELFPELRRITAYARADTLVRRTTEELAQLRQAGLDRVHVGLESGCDEVLEMVRKGADRKRQIEGGRRALQAGFELSLYVMPGLGGVALSERHADDTASVLCAIGPHFVRLRTTAVLPGSPLAELQAEGRYEQPGELEMLRELRRMLAGMTGLETRLESDHSLNLLMELRGELPRDLPALLELLDGFLARPLREQQRFVLARRLGWVMNLESYEDAGLDEAAEEALAELEARGGDLEEAAAALRCRMV